MNFKEFILESEDNIIKAGTIFRTNFKYRNAMGSQIKTKFPNSLPEWKKKNTEYTNYSVKGTIRYEILLRFKKDINFKYWWLQVTLNVKDKESIWDLLEIVDIEPIGIDNCTIYEYSIDTLEWIPICGPIKNYGNYSDLIFNKYNFNEKQLNYLLSEAIEQKIKFLKKDAKRKDFLINYGPSVADQAAKKYMNKEQ